MFTFRGQSGVAVMAQHPSGDMASNAVNVCPSNPSPLAYNSL